MNGTRTSSLCGLLQLGEEAPDYEAEELSQEVRTRAHCYSSRPTNAQPANQAFHEREPHAPEMPVLLASSKASLFVTHAQTHTCTRANTRTQVSSGVNTSLLPPEAVWDRVNGCDTTDCHSGSKTQVDMEMPMAAALRAPARDSSDIAGGAGLMEAEGIAAPLKVAGGACMCVCVFVCADLDARNVMRRPRWALGMRRPHA
jgi:hypothetical protein